MPNGATGWKKAEEPRDKKSRKYKVRRKELEGKKSKNCFQNRLKGVLQIK